MMYLEAAEWLTNRIRSSDGYSYQETLSFEMEEKFGEECTYLNNNGNRAINPKVLAAFRKMSPDIVYVNNEKAWRTKTANDTTRIVND